MHRQLYHFGRSFAELFGGNQAVDRVRGQQVPKTGPTLDYLGSSSELRQAQRY